MKIEFTEEAWEDLSFWIETDYGKVRKIKDLIQSITESPFQGIGKPEPLKYEFQGFWSRRIDREHRLVYRVEGKKGSDQKCVVHQCRFHYEK